MSTRKLLLILVPLSVAALLIFALLRGGHDDESVAGPGVARVLGESFRTEAPAAVLPEAAGSEGARVEQLPVGESGLLETAPPAVTLGAISGRLVDGAGHAIAGEPVYLTLDRDDWTPHANANEEDEKEPPPVVGRGVSDAEGNFAFPARAGARHTLHAGGARWPCTALENVYAGSQLLVSLPEGFVLSGFVVEAETHAPVPGASVLAISDDQHNHLLGTAGADGSFSLGPLPAQDVIVASHAPNFDVALEGEIAPALGPVTIELGPGVPIRGRVVDRETTQAVTSGGEIRLQLVTLATLAGGADTLPGKRVVEELKAEIDDQGLFTFPSGPSAGFRLLVSAPGYTPQNYERYEKRSVRSDDEIVIALRPVQPISGRVVLAEGGAPAPGARVTASNLAAQFATAKAGDDGSFSLDSRDWDGEGPIHVLADDGQGHSGRVRVEEMSAELLVQLVAPLQLAVRVTSAGQPVAGAEVAALSKDSEPTVTRTGKDGVAQLTHPLAGPDAPYVRLQARYADAESLPVMVDPWQPHAETVQLALDGGAVLEGTVTARDGTPVPSALVRLLPEAKDAGDIAQQLVQLGYVEKTVPLGDKPLAGPRSARTDLQGAFRIRGVVPDVPYTARIRVEGYRDVNLPRVYAGGGPLAVVVDPVVLWEGRLVDATTGLPMDQFIGQLLRDAGQGNFKPTKMRVSRKPESPGEFSVELPDTGRYQLRLMAQDYVQALSAPADFDGVRAPPFAALAAWPAAVLEVTIQDGRGLPVPGYTVAVIPAAAALGAETPTGAARKQAVTMRTGDDGLARFNLDEGGSFRIAGGPERWLDDAAVAVKPGSPASRLYRLPPTGILEITITDEQGRPLPGVRVEVNSARSDKQQLVSRAASTHGVDGIVRLESLPPGDYDVTLRRRNYELERRSDVHVSGNMIERLSVAMKPRPKDAPPPGGGKPGGGGAQTAGKGR